MSPIACRFPRVSLAGALAVFLAAASASAVPTTMTYAGVLTDDGVRVEGTADVIFRLFDDDTAGTEQYTEELPGLVIVDGELIAELGSNALDDAILELPELWLEVSVDGTALAPRVRLNSVPYALRAEAALRAEEALTLGGLLPSDLVTAQQLATLGLQNGLLAGTGITVNAGTVSIATAGVTAAQLAPNAVTTAAILDGAVTLAKLANNSVDGAKIVNGSIAAADIGTDVVSATNIAPSAITTSELANNSVTAAKLNGAVGLFQVSAPGCDPAVHSLTTVAFCSQSTSGCTAGQCRGCASDVCGTCPLVSVCGNEFIGTIFP